MSLTDKLTLWLIDILLLKSVLETVAESVGRTLRFSSSFINPLHGIGTDIFQFGKLQCQADKNILGFYFYYT